ncbi:DUF1934 domain-containing protein [Evansella sp. AB-P1]|uniref:DUF1934 domain-containing protein n=1 Tax=Evansella sp. AB-P1 TaxID=3037653 RepID=UPI00241D5322|nr:DUF1934 domain-containing protein [Evansella sp. AB-P1]MDG5787371.1 DUF1934 domain-containing protein [Evansella sp. AB-P1]
MASTKGKPIQIKMKTTIRDGSQKDTTELNAKGHIFHKGSAMFLRFQEPLQEGQNKTTMQTMKIQKNELIVLRKGAVTMNQRFVSGISTEGTYQSPFGIMTMETKTKEIVFNWDNEKHQGSLKLRYSLRLQGSKAGNYEMQVKFKEVER